MNQKELRELIEFLIEKDITEFELERGDVKVRIKRGTPESASAPAERIITVHPAPVAPSPIAVGTPPAAPAPAVVAPAAPEKPEEGLHMVHSPIVGTYYESPSP